MTDPDNKRTVFKQTRHSLFNRIWKKSCTFQLQWRWDNDSDGKHCIGTFLKGRTQTHQSFLQLVVLLPAMVFKVILVFKKCIPVVVCCSQHRELTKCEFHTSKQVWPGSFFYFYSGKILVTPKEIFWSVNRQDGYRNLSGKKVAFFMTLSAVNMQNNNE